MGAPGTKTTVEGDRAPAPVCIRHPDADTLAAAVADALVQALVAALARVPRATVALAGGSTPEPIVARLREARLDWSRVSVTLTDERWVPPTHPDSNEARLQRWLAPGPGRAAELAGLYRPTATPGAALDAVSAALAALPRPFAAVLLGMGDDGHIASLFPQLPELGVGLASRGTRDCVAVDAPCAGHPRLSLTLSALLDTPCLLLACRGEHRRAVLEAALAPADPHRLPVAALLAQRRTPLVVHWAP